MKLLRIITAVFLLEAAEVSNLGFVVGHGAEGITKKQCARMHDAEIVWDLHKYRWKCCIIKNENEYEACLPITDMKPLPKTGIKPFPPHTTRSIRPQKQ